MVSDLYITGYRICTLTFDLDDRKPWSLQAPDGTSVPNHYFLSLSEATMRCLATKLLHKDHSHWLIFHKELLPLFCRFNGFMQTVSVLKLVSFIQDFKAIVEYVMRACGLPEGQVLYLCDLYCNNWVCFGVTRWISVHEKMFYDDKFIIRWHQ